MPARQRRQLEIVASEPRARQRPELRRRPRKVLLAAPRSTCAGVDRAIEIVERALQTFDPPVYVRKQIVHNDHVIADLERRGAIFVESEHDVPVGAVCVFSAHGVSPEVRRDAESRLLLVIDATCPLVAKVHSEARRFAGGRRKIVLIGHRDHEEIQGTAGEAPDDTFVVENERDISALPLDPQHPIAYLTQTTLSVDDTRQLVDALKRRFTDVVGPSKDDICYATQNRQAAVKAIADEADVVLVVGATNSSNSNRLVEVAQAAGTPSYLISDRRPLDVDVLARAGVVGVTSGASVPEHLVDAVLSDLADLGFRDVETRSVATEEVTFALPSFPTRERGPVVARSNG